MKEMIKDSLRVYIYETRDEMGAAAAKAAKEAIDTVIGEKGYANVIFAAAPSQNETLASLLVSGVDFTKINAFHMDEYEGLGLSEPQSFASYLTEHVFGKANFRSVNLLPAKDEDGCEKYSALLEKFPPDVVLLGIGENGHIAFNDPPVADFKDEKLVKKVLLDRVCRMQQVHDGCFPDIDSVPRYALTLTVPALMSAKHLICTVPASTKAEAVKMLMTGKIGEHCPATAMRLHSDAKMFLDAASSALLDLR